MSTLLVKLEEILNTQFSYSDEQINQAREFFRLYKKGQWIYPGVVKRQLSLNIEEVYKILATLEREGVVESWYECICGRCQKALGTVHLFNELPDVFECEVCQKELNTFENTIKIFKVC